MLSTEVKAVLALMIAVVKMPIAKSPRSLKVQLFIRSVPSFHRDGQVHSRSGVWRR